MRLFCAAALALCALACGTGRAGEPVPPPPAVPPEVKPVPKPAPVAPPATPPATPPAATPATPPATPPPSATPPAKVEVPGAEVHKFPDDKTAPVPPAAAKPAEKPDAPPPGAERPKIRHWLDDPANKAAPAVPPTPGTPPGKSDAARDADAQVKPGGSETRAVVVPDQPPAAPDDAQARADAEAREAEEHFQTEARHRERLLAARQAYKQKDFKRAAEISREVMNESPRNQVAAEMLRNAQGQLFRADEGVAIIAGDRQDQNAMLEVLEHAVRPPFKQPTDRPYFPRRSDDVESARRKKISEKLEQRITVDFMKADLEWVLNTLFILTGVNIVADPTALEDKSLTLHVEEVPLKEVLNFIVRNNDKIQYSVTEDAVWITATDAADLKKIMFPRVYPLHFGLISTQANSGGVGTGGARGGQSGRSGGRRGGQQGGFPGGGQPPGGPGAANQIELEPSYIETVLKWIKENKDPQVFPDGSEYFVDRASNQLIVYTTPAGHERIVQFLDYFDQPAIQVLIKARFLDISASNDRELAFSLENVQRRINTDDTMGTVRDPKLGYSLLGGATSTLAAAGVPGSTIFTFIGRRTDPTFQATIKALYSNNNVKILSEPQVLAINNKEATIDIITNFSYITDLRPVTTTNAGGNGTAIQNVSSFVPEFEDEQIGFTLVATPSVGRDMKHINLHLAPVIDSLAQGQQISSFQDFPVATGGTTNTPPVIRRPTIDQTSLETDVVLEDNGYVILGGLLRNRQEVNVRKIPGLGDIPVLGKLFQTRSKSHTRQNLLIIVEAQIIAPSGRTYIADPEPDDVDPREGGTKRAPGQTSDAQSPNIRSALGLAPSLAAEPRKYRPLPPAGRGEEPEPGRERPDVAPRKAVPISPDPATAVAEALGAATRRPTPAPAYPSGTKPSVSGRRIEAPAAAGGDARADKGDSKLTVRERMERLARASRAAAPVAPASARGNWTVSPEEPGPAEQSAPRLPRGEVLAPEN